MPEANEIGSAESIPYFIPEEELYEAAYQEAISRVTPEFVRSLHPRARSYSHYWQRQAAAHIYQNRLLEALQNPDPSTEAEAFFDTIRLCRLDGDQWINNRTGQTYTQVVKVGVERFIAERPEEVGRLADLFIAYGRKLQEDYEAQIVEESVARNRRYDPSIGWETFIAGCTDYGPSHLIRGEYALANKTNEPPEVTDPVKDFWKRIIWGYRTLRLESNNQQWVSTYVLGPGISSKDTGLLLNALELMQAESPKDVLGGGYSKPESAAYNAYDLFVKILHEAGSEGWSNAQKLLVALDKLPKRDIPKHSLIIELANQVTTNLNAARVFDEIKLDKLDLRKLEHVGEAVNRLAYVAFELGAQPASKEPLNFLVTAEIVSQVYYKIARELGQLTGKAPAIGRLGMSELEEDMYSRDDQASFWDEWKERHGLIIERID